MHLPRTLLLQRRASRKHRWREQLRLSPPTSGQQPIWHRKRSSMEKKNLNKKKIVIDHEDHERTHRNAQRSHSMTRQSNARCFKVLRISINQLKRLQQLDQHFFHTFASSAP